MVSTAGRFGVSRRHEEDFRVVVSKGLLWEGPAGDTLERMPVSDRRRPGHTGVKATRPALRSNPVEGRVQNLEVRDRAGHAADEIRISTNGPHGPVSTSCQGKCSSRRGSRMAVRGNSRASRQSVVGLLVGGGDWPVSRLEGGRDGPAVAASSATVGQNKRPTRRGQGPLLEK